MFKPFLMLTASLSLAASPAVAEHKTKLIPPAFHGSWHEPERACQYEFGYVNIEEDSLYFEEAEGTVTSVTIHDKRSISVTAQFTGEWTPGGGKPIRLTLSADGREMTAYVSGAVKLVRCP